MNSQSPPGGPEGGTNDVSVDPEILRDFANNYLSNRLIGDLSRQREQLMDTWPLLASDRFVLGAFPEAEGLIGTFRQVIFRITALIDDIDGLAKFGLEIANELADNYDEVDSSVSQLMQGFARQGDDRSGVTAG